MQTPSDLSRNLRVEHQLEVIDYHKPNFIHADLSLDGLRKAMKDRGEDEMTVVLKVALVRYAIRNKFLDP